MDRKKGYPNILFPNKHNPSTTSFHPASLCQYLLRRARAVYPNIPLNSIADNHRWATSRAGQIDPRQVDARANRVGRAGQINHLFAVLARRRAIDVVKDNVGDVDGGRVCCTLGCIDVEIALVQHNGLIGVLDVDVAVSDVVNASVADVLASPGLETGTILDQVG